MKVAQREQSLLLRTDERRSPARRGLTVGRNEDSSAPRSAVYWATGRENPIPAVAALNVGSDIWRAEMYGTLSVAWRTRAIIKDTRHLLRIRWSYMRLSAHMEDFLGKFYSVFEKAQRRTLPQASEPATPAQLKESIDTLWNLHDSFQGIYDLSVRKGLKSKLLLTSQVEQLACSKERLIDLVQWLTDMSDPGEVKNLNSMLSEAEEEYTSGGKQSQFVRG